MIIIFFLLNDFIKYLLNFSFDSGFSLLNVLFSSKYLVFVVNVSVIYFWCFIFLEYLDSFKFDFKLNNLSILLKIVLFIE